MDVNLIWAWVLMGFALFLLLVGGGFALRWLSWMIRGVGMDLATWLGMTITSAICLTLGLWAVGFAWAVIA